MHDALSERYLLEQGHDLIVLSKCESADLHLIYAIDIEL